MVIPDTFGEILKTNVPVPPDAVKAVEESALPNVVVTPEPLEIVMD